MLAFSKLKGEKIGKRVRTVRHPQTPRFPERNSDDAIGDMKSTIDE